MMATNKKSDARGGDLLGDDEIPAGDNATKFAKEQLRSIIERIERLNEEKKAISDDIRDIMTEARGNGYDVKAIRSIIKIRKQDPHERQEQETILETYLLALGMI